MHSQITCTMSATKSPSLHCRTGERRSNVCGSSSKGNNFLAFRQGEPCRSASLSPAPEAEHPEKETLPPTLEVFAEPHARPRLEELRQFFSMLSDSFVRLSRNGDVR